MSTLKAVIFGAIGTVAETSDLQRQSFNLAFKEAGLNWYWDMPTYKTLLNTNGGQHRLRSYRDADPARADVTDALIEKLHQAKTDQYVELLKTTPISPRPGVVALINQCKQAHLSVAFCTSTSMDNVASIAHAVASELAFDQFATIVTIDKIKRPKPAPDAYLYCLEQLGLAPNEVIAIEDTPVSIAAARAVGIVTLATPGETTSGQDFSQAHMIAPDLLNITIAKLAALLSSHHDKAHALK